MLRRHIEKILLNKVSATGAELLLNGTVVGSSEFPAFDITEVKSYNKYCTTAGRAQVSTVTVVIPDACECPYEWGMTVDAKAFPHTYVPNVNNIKYYNYVHPAGATPVASDVATYIAQAITNDEFSAVDASAAGAVITLKERNPDLSRGFVVSSKSATIATTTTHLDPILGERSLAEQFPIKPGSFASKPKVACGDNYCVYHFVIRKDGLIQDIDMANTYNDYEMEVKFYVNQDGAHAAQFETNYQAIASAIAAL